MKYAAFTCGAHSSNLYERNMLLICGDQIKLYLNNNKSEKCRSAAVITVYNMVRYADILHSCNILFII